MIVQINCLQCSLYHDHSRRGRLSRGSQDLGELLHEAGSELRVNELLRRRDLVGAVGLLGDVEDENVLVDIREAGLGLCISSRLKWSIFSVKTLTLFQGWKTYVDYYAARSLNDLVDSDLSKDSLSV